MAYKVNMGSVSLLSGTDRTVWVKWSFSKKNLDKYQIQVRYRVFDDNSNSDVLFWADSSDTTRKEFTYDAPEVANKVYIRVKPVAKKNKKGKYYWTGKYSAWATYDFKQNPAAVPSVPSIELHTVNGEPVNALKYRIDNINDPLTKYIHITRYEETTKETKNLNALAVTQNAIEYIDYSVKTGCRYRVRASASGSRNTSNFAKSLEAIHGPIYNSWSDPSEWSSVVETGCGNLDFNKLTLSAHDKDTVKVTWSTVTNASTYEVEWVPDDWHFFDTSSESSSQTVSTNAAYIKGLEKGHLYYFRVRAITSSGFKSAWTKSGSSPYYKSIVIGAKPSPPTIYSYVSKVMVGEKLNLYVLHNSGDASSMKEFQIAYTRGGKTITETYTNNRKEEDKDKAYEVECKYNEIFSASAGNEMTWKARTKGISNEWSDWSTSKLIEILENCSVSVSMSDNTGNIDGTFLMSGFPLTLDIDVLPKSQKLTTVHVRVSATEDYEDVMNDGDVRTINAGTVVYTGYFTSNMVAMPDNTYSLKLLPSDINLMTGMSYLLEVSVATDVGLSNSVKMIFDTAWYSEVPEPDAAINFNSANYTATIAPVCLNDDEIPVPGILLGVSRINYDGTLTNLATGINNNGHNYIVDPHPRLDILAYRIIAQDMVTGDITYDDIYGDDPDVASIIIQWDENINDLLVQHPLNMSLEEQIVEHSYGGITLALPYNISTSENTETDVTFVSYAGRKHKVSYYGTHISTAPTWTADIPKSDVNTLSLLRALQIYPGDVYVREPSGVGYHASIKVAFNSKYDDMIIPVNLAITRVEGEY